MYKYDTTLISPFCDSSYYLSAKYCFYFIQEVAGRREMSVGTGIPHLLMENKSWVLLSTHLEFKKKVYWQSDLHFVTEGYEPVGVTVPRRVICKDNDGDLVFTADSVFAVISVDGNKHKIVNPREVTDRSSYDVLNDGFAPRFKKFDVKNFGAPVSIMHKVYHTDCDINGHMNNLKYTSWMISALPSSAFDNGKDIKEMDVCFSHELHLGDEVSIDICFDEKNSTDDSALYYVAIGEAAYGRIVIGKVPKGKPII